MLCCSIPRCLFESALDPSLQATLPEKPFIKVVMGRCLSGILGRLQELYLILIPLHRR